MASLVVLTSSSWWAPWLKCLMQWDGAQESESLTIVQMMLVLFVWVPHFGNSCFRGKVLERTICLLSLPLPSHSLLNPHQLGLIPYHSPGTATVKITSGLLIPKSSLHLAQPLWHTWSPPPHETVLHQVCNPLLSLYWFPFSLTDSSLQVSLAWRPLFFIAYPHSLQNPAHSFI